MTSSNMKWLKAGDLLAVQADPNGTGSGPGQIGKYSGAQLEEDITQLMANTNVQIHVQNDPPPYPGDPNGVGEKDLWFDTSTATMFILVRTEPDASGVRGYVWVIIEPSNRQKILDNLVNDSVDFPSDPSIVEFVHPNTGVVYYYKPTRNIWIDIYAPAEDSIQAIRDSIDVQQDEIEERVKIAGDTMTGDLTMQAGTVIDVGQINNLNNLVPAETLLVEADQTTRYSRIKPVGPRPVTTGVTTGMIIDLSEDNEYNNLVVMGDDTILSINGKNNTTNVEFNTRVNAPSVQLSDSGGLLLRTTGAPAGGNKDLIRAYYDKASGSNNRLIDFYFDGSSETTKLQVDNHPLKITATSSVGIKTNLVQLAIDETDADTIGSYCTIHRLLDPTDDLDAVNLQTLNNSLTDSVSNILDFVDDTYLPLTGGTLTGTLKGKLIKSTRDTGYAFEVKPNDTVTNAYINTDGGAKFTDTKLTGVLNLDNGSTSATCMQVKAYTGTDQRTVTSTWKSNGVLELKPTVTGSEYCFSVRVTGLDGGGNKNVAFRVTSDGKVKAGHDTSNPFLASQDNDVMTQKAVKNGYVQAGTPGIKITKTGSTYYIEGG